MELSVGRILEGIREIMGLMAGIFAHTLLVERFGSHLWTLVLALLAAAAVWFAFHVIIRLLIHRREQAWIIEKAKRYRLTGCWCSLVKPEGKTDAIAVSVLNIQSSEGGLSVNGRTFDIERDDQQKIKQAPGGKVLLKPGGTWESTQAAFSDKTLLYLYTSMSERVSGMCSYLFNWIDASAPPIGYNGMFYDLGGDAFSVEGARVGDPIDINDVRAAELVAQKHLQSRALKGW